MPRCPVCRSAQVVIVVSPRPRAFCTVCGSRWVQEGGDQRSIRQTSAGRILGGQSRPVEEPLHAVWNAEGIR